jgi:UDPglucose 6-dehydrogenase
LLLLTEWKQYRELDWKRIYRDMARPLILDARNMLAPAKMKEMGITALVGPA